MTDGWRGGAGGRGSGRDDDRMGAARRDEPVTKPDSQLSQPVLFHLASLRPESASAIELLTTVEPTEVLAMTTVAELLETVEHTPGCVGLLPVEDSFEGEHTSVLDQLIFETANVFISEEVVVSETLDAFRVPANTGEDLRVAVSHPTRPSSTATGSCGRTASPPGWSARPSRLAAWCRNRATPRWSRSHRRRRPSGSASIRVVGFRSRRRARRAYPILPGRPRGGRADGAGQDHPRADPAARPVGQPRALPAGLRRQRREPGEPPLAPAWLDRGQLLLPRDGRGPHPRRGDAWRPCWPRCGRQGRR